jgi:hypothetical protein
MAKTKPIKKNGVIVPPKATGGAAIKRDVRPVSGSAFTPRMPKPKSK